MKKKQHWLDDTCIGELINNVADGWGKIFMGEKQTSKTADLHPKKGKKKIIKSLETTRKVKKT